MGERAASSDGAGVIASSQPEDDEDGHIFTMDPKPLVLHRHSATSDVHIVHQVVDLYVVFAENNTFHGVILYRITCSAIKINLFYLSGSGKASDDECGDSD